MIKNKSGIKRDGNTRNSLLWDSPATGIVRSQRSEILGKHNVTDKTYISWNEYVTIAVNRNLSNCEKARKKGFRGFNGIRTRGLCVSAAVLYQPELWRPICWRPANLLSSSTRERNETHWNEMMWTAGIQMKWVCDHRSESQFKQLRKSPKKISFCVSFLSRVDELNKLAGLQHMGLLCIRGC